MGKDFLRLTKNIILFTSPVWVLAISYFVFDPFHVLRHYDAYPDNYLKSYNRNRIGTQIFLNHNDSIHYQSFVFGSSRSSVFYTEDWSKYINDPTPFHYDASNEDIKGIYQKLRFIERQGNQIRNALLIFDGETFNPYVDHKESIIHLRDWRLSGQSRFLYHLQFFKAYFKELYFLKYFDTLIGKTYKPYMYGSFENKHMLYTPVKNDFIFQGYIDQIKEDSVAYYARDLFYKRSEKEETAPPLIDYPEPKKEPNSFLEKTEQFLAFEEKNKTDLEYLREIKGIFDENQTEFRIIFGPNYDQKKVNPKDLELVKSLFGAGKVFDYTGKNELTESLSNYYEIYHYKPILARRILEEVYSGSN